MKRNLSFSGRIIRAFSLFCMAIVWCCALQLSAQDIDMNTCPNDEFVFPAVAANVAMTPINISAVNSNGSVEMEIRTVSYESGGFELPHCGTPCSNPQNLFGIDINATGSSITISGTPTDAGVTIIFTLRASDDSGPCDRTYRLPIVRQPLDLAVILDRSGSMGWGYDGSISPPAEQRRWDGLKIGLGVMVGQLQGLDLPGDSVGMRLFASNVITPGAPFNAGLVGMQATLNQLVGVISTETPSGNTALGDGIIAGRDLLLSVNPTHRKAMIVFSDGVQNTGDQVKTIAPNQHTQTNSGQELNGPSDEIDVFTISLGSSGHNPLLMESIANANGGEYLNTLAIPSPENMTDFQTLFSAQINNILMGSSPQYVDVRQGSFPPVSSPEITGGGGSAPVSEQSFSVNKGVSSVIVTLLAPTRYEPHFISIVKDGNELIQYAQQTHGSGFVSIALHYSGNGLPDTTSLGGEWTVRARLGTRPGGEVPYTMMILVDDHLVDPQYSPGAESFKVGQAFNPNVILQRNGNSLENAQVQAMVLKPGDDINDLIARADIDFSVPEVDPGSPDVAKLAVLLQDTAFVNKIKIQDQQFNLTYDDSAGAYKGSFDGLDVAGVYQVIYRITADDPELGKIRRYQRESFYVRFPDIDLDNSQLSISLNTQGNSVIHVVPTTSKDRRIGSGWRKVIELEANNAKISEVIDHGDGSYDVVVDGVLTGPGKISVSGETVYEGDLEQLQNCYGPDANILQRIQCWLISIGLPGWLIWIIILLVVAVIGLYLKKKKKTP